jgi:hypothetical protein
MFLGTIIKLNFNFELFVLVVCADLRLLWFSCFCGVSPVQLVLSICGDCRWIWLSICEICLCCGLIEIVLPRSVNVRPVFFVCLDRLLLVSLEFIFTAVESISGGDWGWLDNHHRASIIHWMSQLFPKWPILLSISISSSILPTEFRNFAESGHRGFRATTICGKSRGGMELQL